MQQAMRVLLAASLISLGSPARLTLKARGTPLSKAVELLTEMDGKIKAEGENSTKTNAKMEAMCKDRTADLGFSIKTLKSSVEDASARIATETVNTENVQDEISKKTETIAGNEADLREATGIRENESALFQAEETELLEVTDSLQRAIRALKRAISNGSFVQSSAPKPVLQALQSLVQGSALSAADASRLSTLIQDRRAAEEEDDSLLGAPDAAVYESQSGNLVGTLQDLLEEAKEQLKSAREAEMSSAYSFAMEKQALEMDTNNTKEALKDGQALLARSTAQKKTATSDKAAASDDLSSEETSLQTLNETCEQARQDFEAETASRAEELRAIATALASLDKAAGAAGRTYAPSFLQRSQLSTNSSGSELTRMLRDLAKNVGTPALSHLASQVALLERGAAAGVDPAGKVLAKIQSIITDLITKLETEYDEQEKCNEDLVANTEIKDKKDTEVALLTANFDRMSSQVALLKEEIAAHQLGLAKLADAQANMIQMRKEEKAEYEQRKSDLAEGLAAVGVAVKALTEFYASAGKDSASGIVGLLEVVQSDFTRDLASTEQEEADAISAFERTSIQNGKEKVKNEEDVALKTKQQTALAKSAKESSMDRAGAQEELAAVNKYLEQRQKECVDKVMTAAERLTQRQDEINGLKKALTILQTEFALGAMPSASSA